MLILGIETSGQSGSLALCRDGCCFEEHVLTSERGRHAQSMAAAIDTLLRQFDLAAEDCDGVAVSIGPGSFTGLRVGVVFAKTFAYASGCALAAVETLQSVAERSPTDVTVVSVISSAQRGDLYVGRYLRTDDGKGPFVREGTIQIVEAASWCANRSADEIVSGPGVDRYESQLSGCCRVLEPEYRNPTAAVIGEMGFRRLLGQAGDDLWSLEPLYIRRSAAEEKEEKEAAEKKRAAAKKSDKHPPISMD